jgi:DNA-binding NtrC family response regulator
MTSDPQPTSSRPELERERDFYRRLLDLGLQDRIEPFLEQALLLLIQIADARRGAIRIWDGGDASQPPLYALERGFEPGEDMAFSHSVIHESFATGETILTASASEDPRFRDQGSVRGNRLEAVLCVPIGARVTGVLYLQDRNRPGPFSDPDRERAETFARHLAPFVDRLLLRHRSRQDEDPTLELRRLLRAEGVIGRSQPMANLLRMAALVAPLRTTVLITGPSGSGKTQLARLIHDNSPVCRGPFVELNCGAIPEELIENELFGAVAGAHATATRKLPGKVAAAEGGTLFLDEIGELPWRAQATLLQLLQSKTYFPLGSSVACKANIRLLAATNADLTSAIAEQRFREDLYYRLNVFPIRVPGLAERRGDVPLLAEHLCRQVCQANELPPMELAPGALRAVESADWPGEIRELGHAIESAVIRARGEASPLVERRHLFPDDPAAGASPGGSAEGEGDDLSFQAATRQFQRRLVERALARSQGNVSAAARALGITRAHLYNLLATFGIRRS